MAKYPHLILFFAKMSTHVTGRDIAPHIDENFKAFAKELKDNEEDPAERLQRYQDVADARLDAVNHDFRAILSNQVDYNNEILGTQPRRWKMPPKANITVAEYRGGVVILEAQPL